MASVDAATAQALLAKYDSAVRRIARSLPTLPHDELISTGRIGVIEAHLTLRPDTSERYWVNKVVRWRMIGLLERDIEARSHEELTDFGQEGVTNGRHDPERAYMRELMYRGISCLEPQAYAVIDGILRGETYAEIALTLGVSATRVGQVQQKALVRLRQFVSDQVR